MGGDKIIPDVTGFDPESAEAKALAKRRGEIFNQKYLPHLKAFPGVRALFERMRNDGLELSIATSAKPEELEKLLRIANVADLVSETASKKKGERSKPDPDIVETAVQQSDFDVAQLVMVGDTPYDVEASGRAGVRSIAFRCGGWPDDRLRGATQIYDGARDMLARYPEFEQAFEKK
jgi:HAD superfamily hydrolase (TIGR01509 family)